MSIFETTSTSMVQPWAPLTGGLTAGADFAQQLLGQGAYGGPFIAGMNPMQQGGIAQGAQTAGQAGGIGQQFMQQGQGLVPGLQQAFGYNQQALSGSSNPWLNNPQPYMDLAGQVADSPYLGGQIQAALRDPFRQLTEQTLPGIQASYSGDMAGHSRGGMDTALATRGYEDRAADVAAQMRGGAYGQGLNFANQAAMGDMSAQQMAAGNLGGMGSQGLGFMGQGYGFGQQGAQDQFGWGQRQYGLENEAINANQQGFYEPWKPLEAYGNYMNPLAASLSSETQVNDQGTLGPLLNIGAQLLGAGIMSDGGLDFGNGNGQFDWSDLWPF